MIHFMQIVVKRTRFAYWCVSSNSGVRSASSCDGVKHSSGLWMVDSSTLSPSAETAAAMLLPSANIYSQLLPCMSVSELVVMVTWCGSIDVCSAAGAVQLCIPKPHAGHICTRSDPHQQHWAVTATVVIVTGLLVASFLPCTQLVLTEIPPLNRFSYQCVCRLVFMFSTRLFCTFLLHAVLPSLL